MNDTCPGCRQTLERSREAPTLVVCPRCQTTYVPEGTESLPFLVTTTGSTREILGAIPLAPEFRERFRITRHLGSGGMGMVVLAEDRLAKIDVALKFLKVAKDPEVRQRFLKEGRLASEIRHPNLVATREILDVGGFPCLVNEYVDGGSLRQRLSVERRLPLGDVLSIVGQVLLGLHACHARGVVHRDVKPENILSTVQGVAKLGDLGIARDYSSADNLLTAEGAVIGTPHYMAPEALRGQRAVIASDIYSVGVILYEALAGVRPHEGRSITDLNRCSGEGGFTPLESVLPDLPRRLTSIVARCLAASADQRPASAQDLSAELDRLSKAERARAADEPVLGPSPGPIQSRKRAPRPFGPRDEIDAMERDAEYTDRMAVEPVSAGPLGGFLDKGRGARMAAVVSVASALVLLVGLVNGVGPALIFALVSIPPYVVIEAIIWFATGIDLGPVRENVEVRNEREGVVRVEYPDGSGGVSSQKLAPGRRLSIAVIRSAVVTVFDERTNLVIRSELVREPSSIVLTRAQDGPPKGDSSTSRRK